MIKQVIVQNYQSHVRTKLELGKITVITGHSDAGKSAFLRALEACAFNQAGTDFLYRSTDEVSTKSSVVFVTDEGTLMWQKSATGAKYVLRTEAGDKEFTKLGRSVPDEVADFLGIKDITIDKGTTYRLQFGSQHEMPFLVGDRGGVAAARVLGRLTGLNVFTNANKRATADKNESARLVDRLAHRVEEIEGTLEQYLSLEDELTYYSGLMKRATEVMQKHSQIARIEQLSADIETNRTAQIESARDVHFDPDELTVLQQQIWCLEGKLLKTVQLEQRVIELKRIRVDLEELIEPPVLPDITVLEELIERFKTLQQLASNLAKVQREYVALDEAEVLFQSYQRQLAEMETNIPLCPFEDQFGAHDGMYRCEEFMRGKGNDS